MYQHGNDSAQQPSILSAKVPEASRSAQLADSQASVVCAGSRAASPSLRHLPEHSHDASSHACGRTVPAAQFQHGHACGAQAEPTSADSAAAQTRMHAEHASSFRSQSPHAGMHDRAQVDGARVPDTWQQLKRDGAHHLSGSPVPRIPCGVGVEPAHIPLGGGTPLEGDTAPRCPHSSALAHTAARAAEQHYCGSIPVQPAFKVDYSASVHEAHASRSHRRTGSDAGCKDRSVGRDAPLASQQPSAGEHSLLTIVQTDLLLLT